MSESSPNLPRPPANPHAKARNKSSHGEPLIWLTGTALAICLLMIAGLLGVVIVKGASFFWPHKLAQADLTAGGKVLGILLQTEDYRKFGAGTNNTSSAGARSQFKVANRDLNGADFRWLEQSEYKAITYPPDAIALERDEYGDFYGYLKAVREDAAIIGEGAGAWNIFNEKHHLARGLARERKRLQDTRDLNLKISSATLTIKRAERTTRPGPERERVIATANAQIAAAQEQFEQLKLRMAELQKQESRFVAVMTTSDGQEKEMALSTIVRAYRPNDMGLGRKAGHYLEKMWEFVSGQPRESNTEGGIFPAIFGTVMMTLIMSVAVVPFGVLAAFYLREYARQGPFVRAVRIAVNNLAGVPSIVFGVFGLGFFVYFVGGTIDQLFYADALPAPTFGTGGIMWASLTLALLTVPVVIVATEESIAAVPRGAKEGSLALGASKFQTICRVVLPASLPGILTGFILAVARGAGEVAPLMITGVVKLAPDLPLDTQFPFVHLDRKFMHLGFHIYDVGFQSPNVEAAKPMVFTTALLLLVVVGALNLFAILIRDKIRKKYRTGAFA